MEIGRIYERKKLLESTMVKNKQATMINTTNGYTIIPNAGGGDCFLYSVIDSGIPLIIGGVNLRTTSLDLVLSLRQIAISGVRDMLRDTPNNPNFTLGLYETALSNSRSSGKEIRLAYNMNNISHANYVYDKNHWNNEQFEQWYELMKTSNYWADNYMIAGLCDKLNIICILVHSTTKIIDCQLLDMLTDIRKLVHIPGKDLGDNSKEVAYTNVDDLQNRGFIIVNYIPRLHFESIRKSDKGFFHNYAEFVADNKELNELFIETCNVFDGPYDAIKKYMEYDGKHIDEIILHLVNVFQLELESDTKIIAFLEKHNQMHKLDLFFS